MVKTGKYPLFDTVTLLWKLWLCLLMQVSVKVHILDIIFFQFWWCRLGLLRGFVPQFSPWWDIPYCLQQSSFMTKSSRRCFREIWLFYPVERLSCEKEIYKLESGITCKLTILLLVIIFFDLHFTHCIDIISFTGYKKSVIFNLKFFVLCSVTVTLSTKTESNWFINIYYYGSD